MALITPTARADIIALVIGMFDAAPGAKYLNQLVTAWEAGTTIPQLAKILSTIPQFAAVYPPNETASEFATRLMANLIPEVTDAAAKTFASDWIVSKLNSGMSRADVIVAAVTAIKATTAPAYANAKLALANQIAVAEYYSVTKQQSDTDLLDLQAVIANVTSSAATVTAAKAFIDANLVGVEFNLTQTGDIFIGNSGSDKIFGNATTLSALDSIDGAGGVDTITLLGVDSTGAAQTLDLGVGTVKNVELAVINAGADTISNGNLTGWTGLTSATVATKTGATITVAGTTDLTLTNIDAAAVAITGGNDVTVSNNVGGTISVTGNGGLATVTTSGGSTVTINDAASDTLTAASISGNAGAATVTSDKLTSLTLINSAQDATITALAGTRAIVVNKMTGGIVTDATATTVNLSSTGAASTGLTLVTAAATAMTIAADEAITLAALTAAATKTLTVTGDSKVTVTSATVTALTSIDASASTGGMTITPTLGVGIAYTGGTGVDTLKLGAHTKAVALGGGNDVVTITAAMGTGGTVTGGDGTDTVIFDGAAVSLAGVTGFETLGLGANATGAYVATGFTGLTLGAVAADVSFTSVAAGTTLTITANTVNDVTYTLADATGKADTLPLVIKGSAAIVNAGTITAAGVETIAITSDDTNTTLANITHEVVFAGNSATTITVTGDAGLKITGAGTGITSVNASGLTNDKVGVNYVADALTGVATLTGSAGADIFDLTAAVFGAAINSGAGNDTVTIGASVGLSTINVGTGTDTVVLGGIQAAAGYYTSVTGMTAGDKINFAAVTNTVSVDGALGGSVILGGASSFANYLDAATATLLVGGGAAEINWFQFNGNTYVVVDNDDGTDTTTFQDGVDSVIELVGLVNLSTSTVVADVLTLV